MGESVKNQVISGALYTAIAKYSSIIISLIVSAILSRELSPSLFGVVAIAIVFINFLSIISAVGFTPAIIQYRDLDDNDIKNIYSFTFYIAIICALFFVAVIPLITLFYNKSNQLGTVCALLSVNIFFSILTTVPNALLLKEKNFKFIAIRTFTIQFVMGLLSVLYAIMYKDIYALLINPIGGSILIYVVTVRNKRIPFSFCFQWESIKKILSYSIYQMGFNLVNTFYKSIDKILIGKYFNMAELGYYEKSYRLMLLPLENISSVINPVLHPVLSAYQEDKSYIFSKYNQIVSIFAWIGFPLSVFLFFSAKELIILWFGNQWDEAVPIFQILSLSVGVQLVQSAIGTIFQTFNRVKLMFIASLYAMCFILFAVIFGIVSGSLELLAYYLVIAFVFTFFVYHYILICRVLKGRLLQFLRILLYPVIYSLCMFGVYYTQSLIFSLHNLLLSLIVKSVILIVLLIPVFRFVGIYKLLRR